MTWYEEEGQRDKPTGPQRQTTEGHSHRPQAQEHMEPQELEKVRKDPPLEPGEGAGPG